MKERIQQEEASKKIEMFKQTITSKYNKLQTASAAAAGGLENADMDEVGEAPVENVSQ